MSSLARTLKRQPRAKSSDYSKIEWPDPEQLIGIEIEVDTPAASRSSLPVIDNGVWSTKNDGSLLHGKEYVLTSPLSGDQLTRAIHDFFRAVPKVSRVSTGSTHLHVDMLEEHTTTDTVQVMVMLFFILEPAIFGMYAPDREWCGYTNKLSSAPDYILGSILSAGFNEVLANRFNGQTNERYYGLNVMSLIKFGSLELRYFPTTTSMDELVEWIKLAQAFKVASLNIGNVGEIDKYLADEQAYDTFLSTYFPQWKENMLKFVPYYAAVAAMNKAMAIKSVFGNAANDYSPGLLGKLAESGKYSKLLKKVKVPEYDTGGINPDATYHIVNPEQPVPNSGTRTIGAVLRTISNDQVYINIGQWIQLTGRTAGPLANNIVARITRGQLTREQALMATSTAMHLIGYHMPVSVVRSRYISLLSETSELLRHTRQSRSEDNQYDPVRPPTLSLDDLVEDYASRNVRFVTPTRPAGGTR